MKISICHGMRTNHTVRCNGWACIAHDRSHVYDNARCNSESCRRHKSIVANKQRVSRACFAKARDDDFIDEDEIANDVANDRDEAINGDIYTQYPIPFDEIDRSCYNTRLNLDLNAQKYRFA
jgi:hypothetical protein